MAGQINHISFQEGDFVKQNQLIASLDPTSYEYAKRLADLQLESVQDEYNRLNQMHQTHSISEGDYTKIKVGLEQAKVQQKIHSKNLTDTKLHSPINGVLIKKLTEIGEVVGVGLPQFVVSDIETVKVSAFLPEDELKSVKIGQKAEVYVPALDSTYSGEVVEISSVADVQSRSFEIKIKVNNTDFQLRPGMIAEVNLNTNTQKEALVIPTSAVLKDLTGATYVYVYDTEKQKAFKRMVELGELIQTNVEVVSGLSNTDQIVIAGQNRLTDGASVTL